MEAGISLISESNLNKWEINEKFNKSHALPIPICMQYTPVAINRGTIFSHRGTHIQLLQKIQTLPDAPEGKTKSILDFEDQGKFNLICLLENM